MQDYLLDEVKMQEVCIEQRTNNKEYSSYTLYNQRKLNSFGVNQQLKRFTYDYMYLFSEGKQNLDKQRLD